MAVLRGGGMIVELVTPIFERPATATASLSNLLRWRSQSRHKAESLGATLAALDGGPDSRELLTELEWLLEDAVDRCVVDGAGGRRKIQGWRRIKRECRCRDDEELGDGGGGDEQTLAGGEIFLRAGLEELEQGWRDRIDRRRPFQYVTGSSHWRDLVLGVQEGVLIPRPETEQLVDLAAAAAAAMAMDDDSSSIWADLGTGSGAIAIGMARTKGIAEVLAVDVSEVAIAVAAANARRYNVENTITFLQGSWLTPLPDKAGKISGIVSNPPYIPSRNLDKLQAEVGQHEPKSALDGGLEGLDHLVEICHGACWALKPGGFLALETDGGDQAFKLADSLSDKPFRDIKVVKDFADISRFVTAFRT